MTKFLSEKQNLRRVLREKLRAQSSSQVADASQEIRARLNEIECESNVVALFLAQPREPNVDEFARNMLKNGKRVFVPHSRDDQTAFGEIAPDWSNVFQGAHGWREPREYSRPQASECLAGNGIDNSIGAVFLPGLAFDLCGNRLGQGGGWYDRALGTLGPRILRVGVCFDFQVVQSVPCEAHDQRVAFIVTEKRVIQTPSFL